MKDLDQHRRTLIDYLLAKVKAEDWHGVADAACDLREVDVERRLTPRPTTNWQPIQVPGKPWTRPDRPTRPTPFFSREEAAEIDKQIQAMQGTASPTIADKLLNDGFEPRCW